MAGSPFLSLFVCKKSTNGGRLQASTFPGKYKRRETAGGQNGKRNEAAGWLVPRSDVLHMSSPQPAKKRFPQQRSAAALRRSIKQPFDENKAAAAFPFR